MQSLPSNHSLHVMMKAEGVSQIFKVPLFPSLVSALLLSLAAATFLFPSESIAQRTDFQAWTLVTTNISLDADKKWFFYMEAQPRVGNDVSRLERILIRPAAGYNINKSVSLFLGYGWTPTFSNSEYESDFRNENRIWQQILISHSDFGLDWQHRIRQEQRMIDDASGVSNRTRYLLRGSYKFCDSDDWGITGYNELFVNLNSVERGPRAGFDRDRFFLGPFYTSGAGRYEVGYLGEYGKRFSSDDRMVNALMFFAHFTL